MKANTKFRVLPFKLKSISEDGVFEGYASVFGNTDSYNEVVVKGAFKKTIAIKKGKFPILWQHQGSSPIGVNIAAEEDDHGLKVTGKLALGMVTGKSAYEWLKVASENELDAGLSIGYRVIDKTADKGIVYLKELELLEYSIVTFPANDLATVTGVKANNNFQDLAFAKNDTGWSADTAVKRILEWAGGEDNLDAAKFGSAFLVSNIDSTDIKSFRLPICDIENGNLVVVKAALLSAARALEFTDVPSTTKEFAKSHILQYTVKLKLDSPFPPMSKFTDGHPLLKAFDFTTALQNEMNRQELCSLRWDIEDAKYTALCSVDEDENMTTDQKMAMVEVIYTQYSAAMTAWYRKWLAYLASEEESEAAPADDPEYVASKAGAAVSKATKKILTNATEYHQKAYGLHRQAHKMSTKGNALLESLVAAKAAQASEEDPLDLRPRKDNPPPPAPASDPAPTAPVIDPAIKAATEALRKQVGL